MGIVIHQRFFMNCSTTKMCLECTILGPMGDAHSTFECYLFTVEVVSSYVSKLKSNVVICELANACTEGYELFGFPLSQSKPPVQHVQHLANLLVKSNSTTPPACSAFIAVPHSGTLTGRVIPNGVWKNVSQSVVNHI
jgi:hypothetical protein